MTEQTPKRADTRCYCDCRPCWLRGFHKDYDCRDCRRRGER